MQGKRRARACHLTVHSKREYLYGIQTKTVTLVEWKPEDLSSIPGIRVLEREQNLVSWPLCVLWHLPLQPQINK